MPRLKRLDPPTNKKNDFLALQYGRKRLKPNSTSQDGEDVVLEEILRIINSSPDEERVVVEFGAWDGKHLSNSWNLINEHGFRGLLIEADRKKYQELEANFENNCSVQTLCRLVSFEGENALENILLNEAVNIPKSFDVLIIDVDGNDYWIWESLKEFQPKVVCIEFNPTIPNHIIFVQDRDMKIQQGSSIRALVELGKAKGYELVCTSLYNAFFVQKVFYDAFGIVDNSLEVMHDCPMPTELFQLYDGTIVLAGTKKLLWHRVKIDEEKIQMLPKGKRRFPHAPANVQETCGITEKTNQKKKKKKKKKTFIKHRFKEKSYRRDMIGTFTLGLIVGGLSTFFLMHQKLKWISKTGNIRNLFPILYTPG